MANTTLHQVSPRMGRAPERGIGESMSVPTCSSSRRSSVSFNRFGRFENCSSLNNGGRKGEEKERSSGLVNPSQHRDRLLLRRSSVASAAPLGEVQTVAANGKLPIDVEMLETYEIKEKVRDYEIDHYGVVNNAIYAQYCQHAMHELLVNIGFSPDSVASYGKSMALAEMKMKYLMPLRSGDKYIVSSRVSGTTAARLCFENFIYKLPNRELVISSTATAVFLDKSYKPSRIPDAVRMKLLGYILRSKSTNCILVAEDAPQRKQLQLHLTALDSSNPYLSTITQYIL